MKIVDIKIKKEASSLVQDAYADNGYVKAHHGSLP